MTHQRELLRRLSAAYTGEISPPESMSADAWAAAPGGITLSPRFSQIAGPLRFDLTPYIRAPLHSFTDDNVRRISLCWGTQSAKSTFLFCCLGYIIDQAPGPTMLMYPSEAAAKAVSKDRLQPMLLECDTTRRHLTGNDDDFALLAYSFDRMTVRFAWSGSEIATRTHPIRYLLQDEKSAFAPGSAAAAAERVKTYWNHKVVAVSTPKHERDPHWREVGLVPISDELNAQALMLTGSWKPKSATTVFFYEIRCPGCRRWIRLEFGQLRWPEKIAIRDIDDAGWYECQACGRPIYDGEKAGLVRAGRWHTDNPGGKWVAYHLSSLYAPWDACRFGAVAGTWLRAKLSQDPEEIGHFVNNWLALPYSIEHEAVQLVDDNAIASNVSSFARNTIPADVRALVVGADVGEHATHYVVLGLAPGPRVFFVSWGLLDTPAEILERVLGNQWQHPDAGPMKVCVGGIDSRYNRATVVDVCKQSHGVLKPVQGANRLVARDRVTAIAHQAKPIERDANGKALPGSLIGYSVNTGYWKGWLYGRFSRTYSDAQSLYMPADRDETLERHLQSEREITRRKRGSTEIEKAWVTRRGFQANHYLDATVYALAIANAFHLLSLAEGCNVATGIPKQKKQQGNNRKGGAGTFDFGRLNF